MPSTTYLHFANYSSKLHKLITGRNCSLLANGLQRRHFGVEIEACDYTMYDDCRLDSYTAEDACESLFSPINEEACTDLYEFKEDGSLCGECFEMVTAPMTMGLLKMLDWDNFFDTIRSHGYLQTDFNDYDKAGIHVHVNRKSFREPFKAAVNALLFITENEDTIRRFARRSACNWDSWCATPYCLSNPDSLQEAINFASSGDYSEFGDAYYKKFSTDESRYRCVNFQSVNTWELRIFNSTLKPQEMHNILDFTEALWQLCDKENYDIDLDQMHDKLLELGNPIAAELMYNPPADIAVSDNYSYRWADEEDDNDEDDDW